MEESESKETGRKVSFCPAVDSITYEDVPEPIMSDIGVVDNVGNRLYEKGKHVIKARERKQHNAELQKLKELEGAKKAKPAITQLAQEMRSEDFKDFLMQQEKWQRDAASRRARKEKELQQEAPDSIEVRRKWTMAQRSDQIIQRKKSRGDYQGPQTGWKAGFSRYIKGKNLEEYEGEDFEPTINVVSKQMVREVPAHERLHALAAEREESLMMLRAWEYDKSMIDDTTGAPRFHPKILNSPRADVHFENSRVRRRSASPSVMSTTSSQFSRRRGYRELMDHLHQREPPPPRPDVSSECTFAPQTNPTSALILERCGSRPPLYPPVGYSEWREQSRSQTPAGHDPPPYDEGGDPAAQHQHGPQEKTPEERRLTKERHKAFMARQVRDYHEKRARQRDLKAELDSKEAQQCTFQPRISKRSDELFRSSSYSVPPDRGTPAPRFKWTSGGGYPGGASSGGARGTSRGRSEGGQHESETAAFIRQLEQDHARDRDEGNRARMARSVSPMGSARGYSRTEELDFTPEDPAAASAASAAAAPHARQQAQEPTSFASASEPLEHQQEHQQQEQEQQQQPAGPSDGDALPSPMGSPHAAPSPFLSTLQHELKNVIDGWRDFDA